MHRFANPNRFLRLGKTILPWSAILAFICIGFGLFFALFLSPPDYQQSETVRIMYVHVPSAWMGLFVYFMISLSSAAALIWKHPLANIIAKASAPVGASFTLICLLTGAIWAKPMWGTWWVWDARLTSVLILFFLYLGYIALNNAFDDPSRGAKASAVLALVGVVNLPIIKFSVDWWNTLHQPASITRFDAPAIHSSMMWPLLMMAVGFTLFYITVLVLRVRSEIAAIKIRNIQLAEPGSF